MKIVFFHELHFGGARRVVGEYAKVLRKKHKIDLYYSSKHKETDFEELFHTAQLYQYESVEYSGKNWKAKLYKDFIEPFKLYFLHRKIAAAIDKEKFDFVFVHPSQFTHAPFILRFLKTPTVYFCHEPLRIAHDPVVSMPTNLSVLKKIYEKVIRKIRMFIDASNIRHATVVLANCKYTQKNIKKAYNISSHVCYLGVDPKLFKPLKMKKQYDVLFVGDTVFMEGYDTLVKIRKLFKNKLRVHVVKKEKGKYISDTELVKEYNKAELVTVLGRYDPFSMIPNEAMACEVCPVVVEEGGPIEAIEDGETGFLLRRDPEKFYEVIKKLLQDDELRKKIGQQGRKSVLAFWNWEKSSQRLIKIIEQTKLIQ